MGKGTKSLSLQKFAGAKKSKFDKRAKAEKKAKRRAKILQKYGKTKARLQKQGKLPYDTQQPETEPQVKLRSGLEEDRHASLELASTERARQRAGPAPDDDIQEEAVGSESEASEPLPQHQQHGSAAVLNPDKGSDAAELWQEEDGASPGEVDAEPEGTKEKRKKWQKPRSQLQLLGDKVAKQKAADQAQKLELMKQKEAHNRQVAQTEKKRKKEKKMLLKKTKRGQPVMKHRIDKILNQLEHS